MNRARPIEALILRIDAHLPPWLRNRAEAVFLLCFCAWTGLPLMLGVSSPGSLSGVLPWWAVRTFGGALVIGCVLQLRGLLSIHQAGGFELVTRVAEYKAGLRICILGTIVYMLAIAAYGQVPLTSAMPILGVLVAWVGFQAVRLVVIRAAEIRRRRGESWISRP